MLFDDHSFRDCFETSSNSFLDRLPSIDGLLQSFVPSAPDGDTGARLVADDAGTGCFAVLVLHFDVFCAQLFQDALHLLVLLLL